MSVVHSCSHLWLVRGTVPLLASALWRFELLTVRSNQMVWDSRHRRYSLQGAASGCHSVKHWFAQLSQNLEPGFQSRLRVAVSVFSSEPASSRPGGHPEWSSTDLQHILKACKPDEWLAGCAAPVAAPAVAAPINQSLLYFKSEEEIVAYPGTVFTGNNGCSPSGLLSFLTIEQQASQLSPSSNRQVSSQH